jgi:leucyl/phenylalanyl-tRNA---protein transferase
MRPATSIMAELRRLPSARQSVVAAAIDMYLRGWFPMHDDERGVTDWVQPRERALLPLDERFRVPRSTRAAIRRGTFEVTFDRAFDEVISQCKDVARGDDGTWLHEDIVTLFRQFHAMGLAHSVEAWLVRGDERTLAGGLYGIALGKVFAGESMFSLPALGGSDASKVCLVHLVHRLRRSGFIALDSQLHNPHLEQFGLFEVQQEEYLARLHEQAAWILDESALVCGSWASDEPSTLDA